MHWLWLPLGAAVLALLYYGAEHIIAWYPNLTWLARLHIPRWTHLEPFFKKSRILIHIVALSYVLFYVTQGIAHGSDWALWVNENVFHFVLFWQRSFTAIEGHEDRDCGYVLYLVLQGIYSCYCPHTSCSIPCERRAAFPRQCFAGVRGYHRTARGWNTTH